MEKRQKRKTGRERDRRAAFPTVTLALDSLGSIWQFCQLLCDLGQARENSDATPSFTFF